MDTAKLADDSTYHNPKQTHPLHTGCNTYISPSMSKRLRSRGEVLEALEAIEAGPTSSAYRNCLGRYPCRRFTLCDPCADKKADELYWQVREKMNRLPRVAGYFNQALTLTRRSLSADMKDAGRYRERVRDTFDILAREFRSGFLHQAGFGAIVVLHQSNIHVHGVYFGPRIADVSNHWHNATGDSDQAKLSPLRTEYDLRKWIVYLRKISPDVTPEDLVFRWNALRHRKGQKGLQTIRRYGSFNGLSKEGRNVPAR